MSFDEQAALRFLEEGNATVDKPIETDDSAIDSFLSGEVKPETPIEPVTQDRAIQPVYDFVGGLNNTFLDLVGLPNDAFNWAAEKLGTDYRAGFGSDELKAYGKEIGLGTSVRGEEPDTGSYRAGSYTATGLTFLAPFLQWTKAASALKSGQMISTVGSKGTTKLVAERMVQPFVAAPKTAFAAELASGVSSGYGSYYGEKEFGQVGGQVGGLIGGIAPVPFVYNAKRSVDYVMRSYLPYTHKGAHAKAGHIIRSLAEDPNIRKAVETSSDNALPNTKLTSGQLTKDQHLQALEKVIINEDPALARELRIQDGINNNIARKDLTALGGDEVVEEAQKLLGSKFMKLQSRLNARVDLALNKVQKAASVLSPSANRKAVNVAVKQQIDNALKDARGVETGLWNTVDKNAVSETSTTSNMFKNILLDRYKADDPSEIPAFLHQFLGKIDESGTLRGGSFKSQETVGNLHALRSRVLKELRVEKGKLDVVDWNKVRILDDMEEAMLQDLSKSGAGKELDDALNFSRMLNQKFKGDIMSTIMKHNKTGGSLSPDIALEGVGTGPKGAVHIKKILAASPDSKDNIEEVLKMELATSKVIKDDRINLQKAKDYVLHNEDTLEIFPRLKADIENAIGLEEKSQWFEKSALSRMKKAKSSVSYKIAEAKPGTVLTTILKSKYPEQEMKKQLSRMNAKGLGGIKNDIIGNILSKSRTEELSQEGINILSGKKALGFWNENKHVLSKAFTKDEQIRIERIIETLRLGDSASDLPMHTASEALKPQRTVLAYAVEVGAARIGAFFGSGTSGASLKTASQGANTARKIMGNLDIGTAKKLLKDAIQDKELFLALSEDMTKLTPDSRSLRLIHGWMVAHAVNSLESSLEDK